MSKPSETRNSRGDGPGPTPEDPSLELVKNVQMGIRPDESFERLYHLHYRRVIFFFRRLRFTYEESRDLTQEVFYRVSRSMAAFRGDSTFGRWVLEIAGNIYRNELRRRSAEKREGLEEPIEVAATDESGHREIRLQSGDLNPLEAALKREQESRYRSALEGLPTQMRHCCELRYEHDLKYHEIAAAMNISVETVKAHLYQARKRLTLKLGTPRKESDSSREQ